MKKKNNKISILGCGWLGLPLAKQLVKQGFLVNGSTTSESKLAVLEEAGIVSFLINVHENAVDGNFTEFLKDSEILLIDIPPKIKDASPEVSGSLSMTFVEKIKNLIPFIEQAAIEKVLFISSTSVYADDNSIVTEETVPKPNTEGGKQLLEAEKSLQSNPNFNTTILRFGGLIGDDRHPIKYLSSRSFGRENLENPEGAINLIHQKDCIGIIEKIMAQPLESWNETFNAVAPFHPTRSIYYTEKAKNLGLPLPQFAANKPSLEKIISSKKIEKKLQYQFNLNLY